MDPKQRRQALLAGVLVLALVGLLIVRQAAGPSGGASYSGTAGVRTPQQTAALSAQTPVADVKLEALTAPRPEPIEEGRSPFRFQPKAPPPPPPAPPGASRPTGSGGKPGGSDAPPVPTGPPPPPPIALKFIGLFDVPGGRKVAILSDGRAVMHAREGEIVDGRYRVVRIGVESIEMEYTDGRGRQVIRLTGS